MKKISIENKQTVDEDFSKELVVSCDYTMGMQDRMSINRFAMIGQTG